jgi:hypothetical protein
MSGEEELAVCRLQAVDREVFEQEPAAQQVHREPADVDGPLQSLGALAFRVAPHGRSHVDRQRADDRRREERHHQHEKVADQPVDHVAPDPAQEDGHWITTSRAPASTEAPADA